MRNKDIKYDNTHEQKDSKILMNIINNSSQNEHYAFNSAKNVHRNQMKDFKNNLIGEDYLKRNSPSLEAMASLNLKDNEKTNINKQNKSFYQDSSPKLNNNFLSLTPQIVLNDQNYLNKKYFPSKANVCKGNPDSNPKFIIPSSSPIVQYFTPGNVETILGGDLGFTLENGNSNCYGERASHLSNISPSDMFNCSPSQFFNRNSYGVNSEKNMEGFLMNEMEGGEDEKKNSSPQEEELYTVELDMENFDVNFKDDDNTILNKINEMKHKKIREKIDLNNSKGNKTSYNNKYAKKSKVNINNIIKDNEEKIKKLKKKPKEINNGNINNKLSNDKNLNENINKEKEKENSPIINANKNNNELIKQNKKVNDNSPSLEENNVEKKFENYLSHFDDHSSSPVVNENENYDINRHETKNKVQNRENNKNNTNVNISKNNMRDDKNVNIDNIFNLNINETGNSNNNLNSNNINYINGMNIKCTNLNINDFSNLNNNQNSNFDQNYQFFNYLHNPNNLMFNQNPNFMMNDLFSINNNIPNIYNYNNNNPYNNLKGMNLYNMNLMNQINPMNIPQFYLQNNMVQNQGYPLFQPNNMSNSQNMMEIQKNKSGQKMISNNNNSMNLNNNMLMNNNNSNQFNMEQKKKKVKRLETSIYIDKPLSYIADNFILLGKDQGACRYIQKLLNDNPVETLKVLYDPLCKNILKLINDPFGNYLIQKIISFLNGDQLLEILKIISSFFYEICCNTHGTRVLQKLIDHSKDPKVKNYFFELLKPLITPLLKELNGTFVVQKFAEVNNEYSNEINEIIVENAPVLSTHRHGCCVIQKYLELKDPIMTPNLLNKLIDNCLLLIIDQFGNYVIQTILLMGDKKYGNKLAEKITENVVYYAKHKYSSNVIEKCFDYCDGIYLQNLMNNVRQKDNLTELILDEHGNYVVQKVLSLSKPNEQKSMLRMIVPLFEKLRNFSYGERVINRLLVSYPIINDNSLFSTDSCEEKEL